MSSLPPKATILRAVEKGPLIAISGHSQDVETHKKTGSNDPASLAGGTEEARPILKLMPIIYDGLYCRLPAWPRRLVIAPRRGEGIGFQGS